MRRRDLIPHWQDRSSCRDRETNDFFAGGGKPPKSITELCMGCPVRAECLQYALASPYVPYGVWGGLQANQILPMWRERHPSK